MTVSQYSYVQLTVSIVYRTLILYPENINILDTRPQAIVNGCSEKSVQQIHHLVDSDIWITRSRFGTLNSFGQRQWILDFVHMHTGSE